MASTNAGYREQVNTKTKTVHLLPQTTDLFTLLDVYLLSKIDTVNQHLAKYKLFSLFALEMRVIKFSFASLINSIQPLKQQFKPCLHMQAQTVIKHLNELFSLCGVSEFHTF